MGICNALNKKILFALSLTIIEACLVVRVGSILHQHTLCLVSVQGCLGCLGTQQVDKVAGMLVLLPVAAGQIMVSVAGVQVEAIVFGGGTVLVACTAEGGDGTKDLNLQSFRKEEIRLCKYLSLPSAGIIIIKWKNKTLSCLSVHLHPIR